MNDSQTIEPTDRGFLLAVGEVGGVGRAETWYGKKIVEPGMEGFLPTGNTHMGQDGEASFVVVVVAGFLLQWCWEREAEPRVDACAQLWPQGCR